MTSMSDSRLRPTLRSPRLGRVDPLWREVIGSAALLGVTSLMLVGMAQLARL
jgi:hypothetical protein